ncbi:RagB/SusD family nutrient uptake outer membrane protein [Dyadobacter psychrotolerans]|uniref:RagB/SusD family nutrient uptake outer membrane protein n=1 Tax=Dyadobacter psychrotolerans TaxID=2541721 RepID=A0A4V2Z422_9BACT|nr:RagB/SusD family nutrient uptake outer membrane protein [Dyadobacter psychrotolerans]TDE14878.1 RagB/SusD family nutrient uptake outer membrane protein [Dyadobacter psychrotolerans]
MKYNLIIIFALALAGCKQSFLDVTPQTYQSSNTFYNTKDQFIQAVNAAYSPLQAIYSGTNVGPGGQLWALAEMRSDNSSYQFNTSDRSGQSLEEIDEFRENNSNSYLSAFFNGSYSGISRCNIILERLAASSAVDAATSSQVSGEASFLRAFYYFNLIRVFGSVPAVYSEVTSTDNSFATASPVASSAIYPKIIEDAVAAISKLPESYTAATDKGRVTKATARTLLAEVYMTQKNWNGALEQLNAIVASGKYQLNANYADNFDVTKENGPESIFEIQYIVGSNSEYSNFIYTFAPWNSGTKVAYLGVAAAGWNIPTQDMLEAYEEGDTRLAASIGRDFTDPTTNTLVPYIKKYQSTHAVRYQTGNNFPVYRYSDVLLMLAESLNETGATASAFTSLNQVRSRAGLAAKTPAQLSSQTAFRQAVAQERRVELAFENHRWFDLLRYGTATEVMTLHAVREKALKTYMVGIAYQAIPLVFPYPLREQLLAP